MMKRPLLPSRQWLLPSATVTVIITSLLVSRVESFLTNSFQSCRTTHPPPYSLAPSRARTPPSFRARLAEQLRLSSQETETNGLSIGVANGDTTSEEESSAAASDASAAATATDNDVAPSSEAAEEARNILEMESNPLPSAPMMTYQKYLTMQEKRVKVAIRYSAEAGLRPFYLTVANQIKSAYPDVLLEKRILSRSDAGGEDAVFEVVVDGKTVIGKKDTKMLKVASRSSRKGGGGDDKGGGGKDDSGKGSAKSGSGDANTPHIAGGRSVFVSLEKLDHELIKARKKRRPSTMYKSKEIAIGAASIDSHATGPARDVEGSQRGTGMTEAVIRLERLKALSTRNRMKNT